MWAASRKRETRRKQTGTRIRWKPDLRYLTEVDVPVAYFQDAQARKVNARLTFLLRVEGEKGFHRRGVLLR